MNLMYTTHKDFFTRNLEWARNLTRKSTLISGTSEKERNKFFINLRSQIEQVKGHCQ